MRNTIRLEFLGLERNDSAQGHFLGLAVSLLPCLFSSEGPRHWPIFSLVTVFVVVVVY